MEGFYRLVSNFQTQSEPAYCGLASLSMVLNALAIDPGRKWKGTIKLRSFPHSFYGFRCPFKCNLLSELSCFIDGIFSSIGGIESILIEPLKKYWYMKMMG